MSATLHLQDDATTGTTIVRPVLFVCPLCGEDRTGVHVQPEGGPSWVDCDECAYRCDDGVLEIPTEATLAEWHAQARRNGRAALRCADGTPACSYLATVWCRRLAPELSLWGKVSFLDGVARPLAGTLTAHQRDVLVRLGVALQMPAGVINDVLDAV